MDPETRYRRLLDEIRAEFPRFRLIPKDRSLLQRSIARLLVLVTFGGQRRYLEGYVTTLGARVYVPASWDPRSADDRSPDDAARAVHLRQFRRWSFPLMALLYLLCRSRSASPGAVIASSAPPTRRRSPPRARCTATPFCAMQHSAPTSSGSSPRAAYGWMWPFRGAVERWYDEQIAALAPRMAVLG